MTHSKGARIDQISGALPVDLLHLTPGREKEVPLYVQLYRRYRDAIAAGKLRPGDRVPSVRSLASELNLARGTVEAAYQMLISEGYFVARGAAGTIVSTRLGSLAELNQNDAPTVSAQAALSPSAVEPEPLPFQPGLPALDAFPHKLWARLAGRNLRTLRTSALVYPDPAGYGPLRHAITRYLSISRGITCSYEQVFVTAGYRGALELAHRSLLKAGDQGWFEDPGYLHARNYLTHAGLHLAPVPVDEEGLNVSKGRQRAARARFAVVTPTHQSPMGMAMSLPRRLELLEWASQQQAWVIEDDYDSEFRYHGHPLPALKSLDRDDRVLYTGTFSKALFPGLQLAYLVIPSSQIQRFRDTANHLPGPGPVLTQASVADFMEQGYFSRHLRKMRSLYATRREYLINALMRELGEYLHIQPRAGGLHVLAHLHTGENDRALAAAAEARGLAVQALSNWRIHNSAQGGLIMGFANFATAREATDSVQRLRKTLLP